MAHEHETDTVASLLEIMHEHDLDRIKVKMGDAVYELVRREAGAQIVAPMAAPPAAAPTPVARNEALPATPPANVKRVTAPLTGVFYSASSPDAEPFVKVGDRVENGSVLCILEAMKLFNEIQSDFSGTIVRIIPENSELVSQGEDLFWIGP